MDFGRAAGRLSWYPGQHDSWRRAEDFHRELMARRRGPSWLGKTPEDFIRAAKERLLARQASWIGHREKTVEDYAAEATAKLLQEKWIKWKRRMSDQREYNQLGKSRPKTAGESADEERHKALSDGWVKWKRRISVKREYGLGPTREKTADELAREAREAKLQMGWIKWKRRLSSKREYGTLGRARSKTEEELQRERVALAQEKGWIELYRVDALNKGWVRRYRGSLWNWNEAKSLSSLQRVDELQEARRLKKLELEWVKNIRQVQLPKFGLGDVRPKTDAELALEKKEAELRDLWESFTCKRQRKMTLLGLGPRRSYTSEELAKMARDEELEKGWLRTFKREEEPTPRLVWLPRIKTAEELELERLHAELEKGWENDVRGPEEPSPTLVWEPRIKTKEELRLENIHKRQETRWYKPIKTYDEIERGFPTVQDLLIAEVEKIWALEDMEEELKETRRLVLQDFRSAHPAQIGGPDWENLMSYYNDMVEIDFVDD